MKPTLLVLAAGMGSRYGGLKQIDPVGPGGETIIDYSVYDAIRAGFGKLVFVIRKDIEAAFREIIGGKFKDKIEIAYVFQELDMLPSDFQLPAERKKPWGTGHAILMAQKAIQEPFGVINGDDFYGATSFKLISDYLQKAKDSDVADYSMVGFTLRNTLSECGSVARGICQSDAGGYLQHAVEHTKIDRDGSGARSTREGGVVEKLSGDEVVSMNLWGFTPSIFNHLQRQFSDFLKKNLREGDATSREKAEFFIPTVVNQLIHTKQARVRVLTSQEKWFGITYQGDRPLVAQSILELVHSGVYPQKLWI